MSKKIINVEEKRRKLSEIQMRANFCIMHILKCEELNNQFEKIAPMNDMKHIILELEDLIFSI